MGFEISRDSSLRFAHLAALGADSCKDIVLFRQNITPFWRFLAP
jgi:hypothetical protein